MGTGVSPPWTNDSSAERRYRTESLMYSSPAIGSDGTVYVGSYDNFQHAIHSNGALKWKYQTRNSVRSSPAIASDGTVFVGSMVNFLYKIHSNGTLKWRYQTWLIFLHQLDLMGQCMWDPMVTVYMLRRRQPVGPL
jgi:outer membrane protein assembly factor BamB